MTSTEIRSTPFMRELISFAGSDVSSHRPQRRAFLENRGVGKTPALASAVAALMGQGKHERVWVVAHASRAGINLGHLVAEMIQSQFSTSVDVDCDVLLRDEPAEGWKEKDNKACAMTMRVSGIRPDKTLFTTTAVFLGAGNDFHVPSSELSDALALRPTAIFGDEPLYYTSGVLGELLRLDASVVVLTGTSFDTTIPKEFAESCERGLVSVSWYQFGEPHVVPLTDSLGGMAIVA